MYLSLYQNFVQIGFQAAFTITSSRAYFTPFILPERISLKTLIWPLQRYQFQCGESLQAGIFQLTGSTLSRLALVTGYTASTTVSFIGTAITFCSLTDWDSTLDLSPGNYWVGLYGWQFVGTQGTPITSVTAGFLPVCQQTIRFNAPTGFCGGSHTTSSSALVSTIHTSQIRQQGTIGAPSLAWPSWIILSA